MRIDVTVPDSATPGQHGVYVCYDAAGEVLYIGRTKNLLQRLQGHRSTSAWFKSMRAIEFTPCDGSNEARDVEKSLIETFHPSANINDFRPQQSSSRQRLPEWTVAKLVTMHEECVAALPKAHEQNERLNNYIAALRNAGWTLAALAEALRMTREGVRIRQCKATRPDATPGLPALPVKVKPRRKVKPRISPERVTMLLDLQAQARLVRGPTPLDSPLRVASERYTELLAEEYVAGVSIYRIARQMGVTHLAIKARLARHGYIEMLDYLPQNVPYGTPGPGLRAECHRGHAYSAENTRFINGDPKRRACRECERIRVQAYRARLAGAA